MLAGSKRDVPFTNSMAPGLRTRAVTVSFFVLGVLCAIDAIMVYKVDLTWYYAVFVFVPLVGIGRWRFPSVFNTLCSIGLLTALLIGGMIGDRMDKGLTYAGKLSLILFLLWPLFRASPRSVHIYLTGAAAVVCANACLISLNAGWGLPTASLTGDGRWQTVLSQSMAMGLPAVAVFTYWFLQMVSIKASVSAGVLALTGLTVAVASGSRGIIILCAITILISAVLVMLRRRRLVVVMALVLVLGSVLPIITPDFSLAGNWVPSRIDSFARMLLDSPEEFADLDPERTQVMLRAVEGIRDYPIVGSGLLSMASTTSAGEPIVVHNRYLSAWAETGLLGFLSLCGITFSWLRMLPAAIAGIRAGEPLCRFNCIWSITVLVQFAVFGLFFPVGVQIDDWGFFMVAETLLTATLGSGAIRSVPRLDRVPVAVLPTLSQARSNTLRQRSCPVV